MRVKIDAIQPDEVDYENLTLIYRDTLVWLAFTRAFRDWHMKKEVRHDKNKNSTLKAIFPTKHGFNQALRRLKINR